MRIFNEDAASYIQALAISIGKDPASLEAWRCLHLKPAEGEHVGLHLVNKVKESYPNIDCDMVCCGDGDVLLISRELNTVALQNLGDLLTLGLTCGCETAIYDLCLDWRIIRSLLLAKTGPTPATLQADDGEAVDFGETESLQIAFAEAKKFRSARHPQYVMVVDDDLLTRRLVAGAFKDKYVLITAADAQEAVASYLLHAPDIVFLDINMPGIGGFAVLRQLIASDPEAYVVMFSGNGYLDNVTAALSKGASGFVAKPFKKDKLRQYIEGSAAHHGKHV